MTPQSIGLILLAAGRGTRFGGAKLAAPLHGKPLARHAADMLAAIGFSAHLAVVGPDTPPLPGYHTVLLNPPGAVQSRSLAQGVAALADAPIDAVLIALADMPLVPREHIGAMIAGFDGDRLASLGPHGPLPPALFGRPHFAALMAQSGDRGAGALLRGAPALALPADAAIDIDTPADLARVNQMTRDRPT